MKKKCVILGSNSYLAKNLDTYLTDMDVFTLNHSNWINNLELIKNADYVLNFCISPKDFLQDVLVDDVIDIQIARELQDSNALFYFMSTRKVYGQSASLVTYDEDSELKPFDHYSKNKVTIEQELRKILCDRLSILRISNILGVPEKKIGYKTFMGWITQNYLERGKLYLSESKSTVRDFITIRYFHYVLSNLVRHSVVGIHNISSNLKIPLGVVLGEMVGEQNIIEKKTIPTDQFLLSNKKTTKYINKVLTEDDFLAEITEYRKLLLLLAEQRKDLE